MLRKIIHFLCGVGIGILLIAVVIISIYYQILPSRIFAGIYSGLIGGIWTYLGVAFVLRGKAKMFTLGFNTIWFVLSFTLVVIGIIAGIRGQLHDLWFIRITGLSGIVFFGIGYWVILKKARDAELRKIMSEDLTFSGNKEKKDISDE